MVFVTPVSATGINVQGELSHAAGGALIACVITGTVSDKYCPEHLAMIGFTESTAVVLIWEGVEMAGG